MGNDDLSTKIVNEIKYTFINENIDIENVRDSTINVAVDNMIYKKIPLTNQIDDSIKDLDDCLIFYCFDKFDRDQIQGTPSEYIDILEQKISDRMLKIDLNGKYVKIYTIVYSLSDKLLFDNLVKQLKVNSKILSNLKKLGVNIKKIECKSIFISNVTREEHCVTIDSRIRSLEISRDIYLDNSKKNKVSINGYAFIAKLSDIVEIYNNLGSELFRRNVRYSINDNLEVDSQIINTLNTAPEEFCFLNNGITMVIEDNDFCLNKSGHISFKYKRNKSISIINGAQTISASSSFFYGDDKIYNKDVRYNAKEKAKVIFRVMQISKKYNSVMSDDEYETVCNKEFGKISISLNRQKPVQMQDIAYTTPFVSTLNELYENKRIGECAFKILKRGEENVNGYDLVRFSKIVKSYLCQQPGLARTKSGNDLLAVDLNSSEGNFKEQDIFKEEIIDDISIFQKYYRPVNFAVKLENAYKNKCKGIKKKDLNKFSTNKKVVLSNGSMHFVAYIIYVLNSYSNCDFSNFNPDYDKLNNIKFTGKDGYIERFIDLFTEVINEIKETSDSNDFKKEDIYIYLKQYLEENCEKQLNDNLKILINKYNEEVREFFLKDIIKDKELSIAEKEVAITVEENQISMESLMIN